MGATSSSPSAPPTSTSYIACPANQKFFTANNRKFEIDCNADFAGGQDLGNNEGSGLLDCIKQCAAKPACSAVVYTWTGACYFKSVDAQYVYKTSGQAAMAVNVYGKQPHQTSACPRPSSRIERASPPEIGMKNSTSTVTSQGPISSTFSSTIDSALVAKPQNEVPEKSLTFLAIGDSITYGYLSGQAYNSYRLGMIDLLTETTPLWNVRQSKKASAMYQSIYAVGSIRSGNFTQNANEGFDGGNIPTIRINWLDRYCHYSRTPDVVTLLAGIHDVAENPSDIKAIVAISHLSSLLEDLFQAYPHIVVIVSTLTPVTVPAWQAGVTSFNKALPGLIKGMVGKKIIVVDGGVALNRSKDLADFVHPNAGGYQKLAKVFSQGIKVARDRKWLA